MGRKENVLIFQDTEQLVNNHTGLSDAVKYSVANQRLILEQDEVFKTEENEIPAFERYQEKAKVIVSKKKTYEAASAYKGQKVCVHNFASATTPGGGVGKGSSAQEECLCRCSTLYFCLNTPLMWDGFYTPHRNSENPIHNDDCIYTPDVVVMKTDTAFPELMQEKDWYKVNVVTCAAPNLRSMPSNEMNMGDGNKKVNISEKELLALHENRVSRILDIAAAGENEVVILGAFGCGAFENNPEVVAMAAKNVVKKYLHSFKTIEFAIYCSPSDEQNFTIFNRVLNNIL